MKIIALITVLALSSCARETQIEPTQGVKFAKVVFYKNSIKSDSTRISTIF